MFMTLWSNKTEGVGFGKVPLQLLGQTCLEVQNEIKNNHWTLENYWDEWDWSVKTQETGLEAF